MADTAWARSAAVPHSLCWAHHLLCVLLYRNRFSPTDTAENLKKHGGFIPSIHSGERTAEYIDCVTTRITVLGATYLAVVLLVPEILNVYARVPIYLGGVSALIVVCTVLDILHQCKN
jgi:preprotein translocase subunit SecY